MRTLPFLAPSLLVATVVIAAVGGAAPCDLLGARCGAETPAAALPTGIPAAETPTLAYEAPEPPVGTLPACAATEPLAAEGDPAGAEAPDRLARVVAAAGGTGAGCGD